MPKVRRVKIVSRETAKELYYEVEIAVRADGSMPARAFLDALKSKMLPNDPDDLQLPSDAQLGDYWHFIRACRHLAEYGEPKYSRQVNHLQDGVWEFKAGAKRISWYDTDGEGGYVAKPRIDDHRNSPNPDSDFWWFPDFDDTIRLGHSFVKTGRRTSDTDIELLLTTRGEDLDHDRE